MGTRRNAYTWAAGTGWVQKQSTQSRDYGDYCNESWALLISFFRWYPDIMLDVFRQEDAMYELPLIHRVILRGNARYRLVDITGSRGLGKTTTAIQGFGTAGLLWPKRNTVYTGPSYKQLAGLAKDAWRTFSNDYPTLAEQWVIDSEGKDSWRISTQLGSAVGITSNRGGNYTDVSADEIAQEENPPFDADDYQTITLYAVRTEHMVGKKRDPTSISFQQRTITSAGRRQSFAYENRKNHIREMVIGESALVIDIPWQVVVLNGIRPIEWAIDRKKNTTYDRWLREMEAVYTGTDQNPIIRDEVLLECRKVQIMEEHHCCKDADCKLRPQDVIYIIGYDVSSENTKGNARCAVVVLKLTKQNNPMKRDKYLKQVVYVDDWPPPDVGMEQAQKLKQLWYQFTYEGSETYIAIDARSYGKSVVENLMMDLGDGLPPLCTMDHNAYTELELPGALPVLYTVKATGGNAIRSGGGLDRDSDMVQYAELQFENHNVELLISNRNKGIEAYKKYHRIKDDLLNYRIDRPYKKTAELVVQIQNLKKVLSGSGIQEKRISSRVQRDSWSALKYALRVAEILEMRYLIIPTQKSEWTEYFDRLKKMPATTAPAKARSGGRVVTARRGGRLF